MMKSSASNLRSDRGPIIVLPVIVLVVATLAVMGPLCGADFSGWDDDATLFRNPRMNPPSWSGVAHYWSHPYMELYVPVTYTVWSGLAAVGRVDTPDPVSGAQMNPWIFHAFNVLVHLANVLLVFTILRRLFPNSGNWAACLGAMLYAIHPVQVEPVAWTSGTKDLLCAFFSLLAILQYLFYATSPTHKRLHFLLGLFAMVLGFLSKPTAMVTPAILAVLDLWMLQRPWKQVARSLWPWFALILPMMVLAKMVQPSTTVQGMPLPARPLLVGATIAFYLGKLLAPVHLAFDYGWKPRTLLQTQWFYVLWIIPAGLGVAVWLIRRRCPEAIAAALIFVLGFAPVIGLTTFEFQTHSTVADHYLYLAMLGPALLLVWLLGRVPAPRRGAVYTFTALLLAAYSVRAALQVPVWRDMITLNRHILQINPHSAAAHDNLGAGYELRARQFEAEGKSKEAYETFNTAYQHYTTASDLRPDKIEPIANRAVVLLRLADLEKDPQTRRDDLEQAVALAQRVLQDEPGNADIAKTLQAAREKLAKYAPLP